MRRVARRIGTTLGIGGSATLLAARALPPEYKDRADDYIDAICNEMLPAVAREGLADAVDAFCERIAFTPEQTRRVFEKVRAMAVRGTVAVLLPGAYYALRETKLPPIDAFRANGVPIAIATDCNPGTSPLLSLRLAMSMACTQKRQTPEEALR